MKLPENQNGSNGEGSVGRLDSTHNSPQSVIHAQPGPKILMMSQVTPREISWLWPGRIPVGHLTLLWGDPGEGKTLAAEDVAARVSRGLPWPDGAMAPTRNVLLLALEDPIEEVVWGRLDAAGADQARIGAIEEVLSLPDDIPTIECKIREMQAGLVVIDALLDSLGGKQNNYSAVRRALNPLGRVARQTQSAILAILHPTKGKGSNPLHHGLGSLAITGTANSVFCIAPDPNDEDRRVLAHVRNKLGPLASSLLFQPVPDEKNNPRIEWLGSCDLTAKDLFARKKGREEKIPQALNLLQQLLSNGPLPVKTIMARAQKANISWRTIERAKSILGITKDRKGYGSQGHWTMQLPPSNDNHNDPMETANDNPAIIPIPQHQDSNCDLDHEDEA